MKAFFIAKLNIKDIEKFQRYAQGASASMQPFGGEVLIKGKIANQLAGISVYQNTAVVSFPSQEKLDSWYSSDDYQALLPLRDEAADILITSYDIPA